MSFRRWLMIKKSEIEPVEYIESDGNQYIQLDYNINYNTIIDCDFAFTSNSETSAILGYRQNQSKTGNIFWFGVLNRKLFCRLGTGNDGTTNIPINTNEFNNYQIKSDHLFYFNNSSVGSNFVVKEDISLGNTCVFTVGGVEGTDLTKAKGKLRYLRFIENDQLMLDLLPVLDLNGTPCLYDRVNDKFYYNSGTGQFTYKKWNFTNVDSINLTSDNYIDTEYFPNQKTSFRIKYLVSGKNTLYDANTPYGVVGKGLQADNVDGGILRTFPGTLNVYRVGWGTGRGSNKDISAELSNLNTLYEDYYDKNIVYINENQVAVLPNTQDWTALNSLTINGRHIDTGDVNSFPLSATYYYAQAYEDNIEMFNFTPVMDENNNYGFYDSVRNKIFNVNG